MIVPVPKLGGVISKDDVFKKGKHDYVAWARIAHYMNEHANGWHFQVKSWHSADGQPQHVWKAPNGTGYLTTCFIGYDGGTTPDFTYAITDYNNKPVTYEKIDARLFTDSARRAFAANAAMTFGLGYELWAREEVGDGFVPESKDQGSNVISLKQTPTPTQAQESTPTAEEGAPESEPLSAADREEILAMLASMHESDPKGFTAFTKAFKAEFGLSAKEKVSDHINEQQHGAFCQVYLASASQAS